MSQIIYEYKKKSTLVKITGLNIYIPQDWASWQGWQNPSERWEYVIDLKTTGFVTFEYLDKDDILWY